MTEPKIVEFLEKIGDPDLCWASLKPVEQKTGSLARGEKGGLPGWAGEHHLH
jgi:hypothetical protein